MAVRRRSVLAPLLAIAMVIAVAPSDAAAGPGSGADDPIVAELALLLSRLAAVEPAAPAPATRMRDGPGLAVNGLAILAGGGTAALALPIETVATVHLPYAGEGTDPPPGLEARLRPLLRLALAHRDCVLHLTVHPRGGDDARAGLARARLDRIARDLAAHLDAARIADAVVAPADGALAARVDVELVCPPGRL